MQKINIDGIEYEITDDMFIEEEAIKTCDFNNCTEQVFLVEIKKNYVKQTLLSFLDLEKDKKQIEELNKLLQKRFVMSNFDLCKKHINEIYNFILEIFNQTTNDSKTKIFKVSEDKNLIGFLNFPFQNISDFFKYKLNEHFCNEIYFDLFDNQDNLRKSIIEKLTIQLNITKEELFATGVKESEFIWFLNNYYYSSILINWQKNFSLEQYIGKDNNQGKFHGPDFIFKDNKTNKTYGFEILELNKVVFNIPKQVKEGKRDLKQFLENITKQIQQRGGTLENYLKTTKLEIGKKIDKWKNYQKTDYKFIGIVVNQSWPDEWNYIFEILMNSFYISANKINGIIFL